MGTFSTFNDNALQRSLERFKVALDREMAVRNLPAPPKVEPYRFRSHRAELFNELYSYYEKSYKKNVWEEYRKWLARNKYKHSTKKVEEFKDSQHFRKQISVKSFCSYWLGFLKTDDLFFLLSIAKDKYHRGENFNKWLFWAIKKQDMV